MTNEEFRRDILAGIPENLPKPREYDRSVNHAPRRKDILSREEKELALKNALRYFPARMHAELAPEFARELHDYGRIYMYRFRPLRRAIRAMLSAFFMPVTPSHSKSFIYPPRPVQPRKHWI